MISLRSLSNVLMMDLVKDARERAYATAILIALCVT
jgi:hypothetical protein